MISKASESSANGPDEPWEVWSERPKLAAVANNLYHIAQRIEQRCDEVLIGIEDPDYAEFVERALKTLMDATRGTHYVETCLGDPEVDKFMTGFVSQHAPDIADDYSDLVSQYIGTMTTSSDSHEDDAFLGRHPRLSSKELVHKLIHHGFKVIRNHGDHRIMKHPSGKQCTILSGRETVAPQTLKSILNQSGLTYADLQ